MTPKMILPTGIVLRQNNTHVAVIKNNRIEVFVKGFQLEELIFLPERVRVLSISDEDDLFEIFENYDEMNRINFAELNQSILN